MLTGFSLIRSSASGGPVQVAAAGLAVDQRALLAELLEALRGHGHAATAAEVGLGHLDDGHAAMAEELVVVGEDGGWKIPSQLTAVALDQGEVGLGAAQLLPERRLLAPPLGLAGLEARLGLLGFRGQSLPELHEVQDLFLDPGLFLLDLLDLGEDGGVLLVRLDLVELALELLPLDPVVLEVLLLRALALPGGIEPRLGRLHRLARLIHGGVHGGDLAGEPGQLGLQPGDPGVERLQVYERAKLGVHLILSGETWAPHPRPLPGGERESRWWAHLDSNQDRTGYEPGALPIELWARAS